MSPGGNVGADAVRLAVAEVIHRYAYNVRHGLTSAFEALFTPDAEYQITSASPLDETYPEGRTLVGRPAILEFLAGTDRPGLRIVPFISNVIVDVAGDVASSTCLMTNKLYPAGEAVTGEYRDTFLKLDGWRFSRRIFVRYLQPGNIAQGEQP